MKKTVAVTVYVDVEVSKGGWKKAVQFARQNVRVSDGAECGLGGTFTCCESGKPRHADVLCDGYYQTPKKAVKR